MRPVAKIGVFALISFCVIFYQYHLSTNVRFDQLRDFNGPSVIDDLGNTSNANYNLFHSSRIYEEAIRSAVSSVQKSSGLSPDVASQLERELVEKLLLRQHAPAPIALQTQENEPAFLATSAEPLTTARKEISENVDPLYIVTPTYRRPEQIAELTRMSHTLMLVKNVHWLVIEDAEVTTKQVTKLLQKTGLKFEHLVAPMPEKYKSKKGAKPRGVSNRNLGLQWVQANATNGVMYFADDDNTYDIELFEEIRKTKRVSMFPVGLCTKFGLSSPILKNGKFAGFYDGWIAGRKFPVDMAGFAVNVDFLHQRPNAEMPYRAGFEEDGFLKSLAPLEPREIEMLADNCTRVLAWHTQTKKNEPSAPLNMKLYGSTNLVKLKQQIM